MTPNEILSQVSDVTGVPVEIILGKNRTERVSEARFMAAWLMREMLFLTFAQIGAALSRSDHSSAMHCYSRANHLRETNQQFREKSDNIKERV